MIYVTFKNEQKGVQISFEDILFGVTPEALMPDPSDVCGTRTYVCEKPSQKLLERYEDVIGLATRDLMVFYDKYINLIERAKANDKTLFKSFKIPKKNGGFRQIDAPNPELMEALRELKAIFEMRCLAPYHTSAYAYIKGRDVTSAVKKHQKNDSMYFLKLDFHDFFGSTTKDFVIAQLEHIFPFSEMLSKQATRFILTEILSLCFLKNKLPQGTPMSPMLTNIMMVPIDHEISKMLRNYTIPDSESSRNICYTRYADDMLLSCSYSFKWPLVIASIKEVLKRFNAPFKLNNDKTRYGARYGHNYNLGMSLSMNNQITVGDTQNKTMRATIDRFIKDYKDGIYWNKEDVQKLAGKLEWYHNVNGEADIERFKYFDKKYCCSVNAAIKSILKTPC